MQVKTKISGMAELVSYLKALPRGTRIVAMREIATYLIGNKNHGLAHAPARIVHNADNPYQWQSEKQRKAYFASDGFGGGIPYRRTENLSSGWVYTQGNSDWTRVNLENVEPYAGYVQGDAMQKGHRADGWRNYMDIIKTNLNGAIQSAQRKVDEWVKAHG